MIAVDRDAILERVVKELDKYLTEHRIIIPTERFASLARHCAATVELFSRSLVETATTNRVTEDLIRIIGHVAVDAAGDEVHSVLLLRRQEHLRKQNGGLIS